MYSIGKKIRELRQKNDMTQERLADFLCVSYQAVSKWENGLSNPDLSLIASIARLFHITTDELLGLCEPEIDERREMFDRACKDGGWTMEFEDEYALAVEAVAEYPGEMKYLEWLGSCTYKHAFSYYGSDETSYRAELEKSVEINKTVLECADDGELKESAIFDIVLALSWLGRRDEAKVYAELYPKDNKHKCMVMENCLEGEEKRRYHQQATMEHIRELFSIHLGFVYSSEILDIKENIIRAMIPDGNFLGFWEFLSHIDLARAGVCDKRAEHDEAVSWIRRALECAVKYDSLEGKIRYTSPLFDLLLYDADTKHKYEREYDTVKSCVEELIDDCEANRSASLREREDFRALIAEAKAFLKEHGKA